VKTSVVFLPGLLCDAQLWQPQIVGLGPSIEPWVSELMRDDSIAGMASRALMVLAENGGFAGVSEQLLPLCVHGSRLSDTPLVELIKDMANNVGKDAFLRQQQAIMQRPNPRDTLWKIRCPTLVLCGEHDLLTPRDRHEEIAAAIRGSTLVVLPGCGHLSTLEKPLEVNRALSAWLTVGGQAG